MNDTPTREPDPALLEQAAAGDDAALTDLYRHFGGPVFTVALRMLASRDAAEDVLQDVFVALPRTLRQFRGDGPFWGWLRRVVVTRVLMRMRAERTRPWLSVWWRSVDESEAMDERAENAGERLVLARDLELALAQLAPESRAVVWLHDVEGWTHREIAAAMGRTASYSKSQLARAHVRLRALLEPGAGEPDGGAPMKTRSTPATRSGMATAPGMVPVENYDACKARRPAGPA